MDIQKIGVVGGGTLGRNIARAIAGKGVDVVLCDVDEAVCAQISAKLKEELDYEITRWSITPSEKNAILNRIKVTWKKGELNAMPMVIEAIQDTNIQEKIDLFNELDGICKQSTIFLTNTAVFSTTELAGKSKRPDRFMGVHFLFPVHKIKTVEIVSALTTTDVTYDQVKEFLEKIGKKTVMIHESPGYISTRMLSVWINEAFHLLHHRISSKEDIDYIVKQAFSSKYGPLALADRLGLDTVQVWMKQLAKQLGEPRYYPSPALNRLVNANFLGKKVGRGVYNYEKNENENGKSEE